MPKISASGQDRVKSDLTLQGMICEKAKSAMAAVEGSIVDLCWMGLGGMGPPIHLWPRHLGDGPHGNDIWTSRWDQGQGRLA